jgi:hypothetical protein
MVSVLRVHCVCFWAVGASAVNGLTAAVLATNRPSRSYADISKCLVKRVAVRCGRQGRREARRRSLRLFDQFRFDQAPALLRGFHFPVRRGDDLLCESCEQRLKPHVSVDPKQRAVDEAWSGCLRAPMSTRPKTLGRYHRPLRRVHRV